LGPRVTGIYNILNILFDPDAIPDYAVINSDDNVSTNPTIARPISPLLNDPLKNKCDEVRVNTANSTVLYDIQNIDVVDIVDSQIDIANQLILLTMYNLLLLFLLQNY